MKSQARVVVIGGGAVGIATLYHLTRKGWSDVVLVERKELTSGSTWHAAGLLPLFNMSYSVGQIHKYSVALYERLQEETGQDVGLRQVSNIRLALNRDRMDEYHQYAGVAETIGVEVEFLSPQQVKEIWPLCNIEGVIGAIRHPQDGYIQPADVTQAMARGARAGGAEIYRQTRVVGIEQKPSGEWLVKTDKGHIACEHVVSATGNFARQTGAMVGLEVPVIPVEHQYIVTEPHPEILRRQREGLPERACCANPTAPGTCARRRAACCSGRTSKARPAATRTGRPRMPSTSCSPRISSGSPHTSRPRSTACRPSARSGSRKSTTARSRTRRMAARSSARPGACAISG
jgi:dimethylglycine dehydrogenase